MRKLLYIILFVVLFIWFFIYTFPVDIVIGHYLNKYNINYKNISGNLLQIKIEEVSYSNFKASNIVITPRILEINIDINRQIKAKIKPNKTVIINAKDIKLEDYQIEPILYGKLRTQLKVFIDQKFITLDGNFVLNIREFKTYGLTNLNIDTKLTKKEKSTKVDSTLTGSTINGKFNGELIIPAQNIYNTKITGLFEGKLYGNTIRQQITINPFKYLR
ncbi:MAG: hypothetical protein GXO22_03350 [Aquificae bacterium]|nr:hypothetical protein [Aquificota bacterium]